MEQGQLIFILGILKGVSSQATDSDIKYALEFATETVGKIAQGYKLINPEEQEPTIEGETETIEEE